MVFSKYMVFGKYIQYFSSYLIFSISPVDMTQQNLNTWNLECALNVPDKVRQENHVHSQDYK